MPSNRTAWRPRLALTLIVAQLLLMLGSWLYGAAFPASGVHSLLSGEGLRWLLGRYADSMASGVLVWIILLSMAWGVLRRSGVLRVVGGWRGGATGYRERRALLLALAFLAVCVVGMLLLTAVPHAVMLSATGSLWPSPFSSSIVPVAALELTVFGSMYGMISGSFHTFADIYDALSGGISSAAPWLLFYLLVTQLYYSLCFVLP